MNTDMHIPSDALKPFVKAYLNMESHDELTNRILPDTSLVMVFKYKGQVNFIMGDSRRSAPSFAISGLRKSARLINYAKNSGSILVIFKEAGAAAFFKEPLNELFEESISLDIFTSRQRLSLIEEQLTEAKNTCQRIAIIETFLQSRLYDRSPDPLILTALQTIHLAKGTIKIQDLAGALHISQDAFEKRFRRIVGTSPKQFSSIVRMKAIIAGGRQKQRLSEIAFDAGYFDQAHFSKEFRLFTGQSPTDFFKVPSVQ